MVDPLSYFSFQTVPGVIHFYDKNITESQTGKEEGKKEIFILMMHSTHFIYGYMASDIW